MNICLNSISNSNVIIYARAYADDKNVYRRSQDEIINNKCTVHSNWLYDAYFFFFYWDRISGFPCCVLLRAQVCRCAFSFTWHKFCAFKTDMVLCDKNCSAQWSLLCLCSVLFPYFSSFFFVPIAKRVVNDDNMLRSLAVAMASQPNFAEQSNQFAHTISLKCTFFCYFWFKIHNPNCHA